MNPEGEQVSYGAGKIFEHLIQPVNKEKSAAFRGTHPIWLHLLDEFRTLEWGQIMKEMEEFAFIQIV
ncbi:hypothetical protein A3J11_01845 [Candidatus Kaiserbacteria bacterium RIFCSPLOWO2_02_FULL_55_12]|uniref:Uncharacterized protein n=1 Tax=Candidatus Kaiserbacteria bacterium RIFCSPLOWO2_02_FULL_55_12 TaxID=1798522 RepID=A0A1F6F0A2_9BACT|nr:MAG: hypothetical protein A3J11_01845 [Candidatus Kaiserbacteria bacterium RIFCSPLOWO2_02_FULL_55_12]